MNKNLKVIITGATGMVGEGVLHECIHHPDIQEILVLGRRSCQVNHSKVKELILADFFNLDSIESTLQGYDACFFCLGVSSVGMKEPEYKKLTYDLTLNLAQTLQKWNPDLTFCYISGAGTDSSEKGSSMWARIKGKTENDLKKVGFKKVYNFRPAIIQPTPGLKNTLKLYTYFGWLAPIIKFIAPAAIGTLKELGLAMIHSLTQGYEKDTLEVTDIRALSK